MARDDLFSYTAERDGEGEAGVEERIFRNQPLAARMRPRDLKEFVGQSHILGPGQLLRRAIEADRIQSLIFYGPPGTGKTSLAQIIARQTKSKFERLSGVEANVADLRRVLSTATNRLANRGQNTILFIDEIHRFNKAQQDVLLPDPEGVIRITLGVAEQSIQRKAIVYDADGDAHYDTISAFIKSVRGSDPDAALYWLAKMIEAGEDPRFITRRMIICAAEDVGLADPMALVVGQAAHQAAEFGGLPETHSHRAWATIYLAPAEKSATRQLA